MNEHVRLGEQPSGLPPANLKSAFTSKAPDRAAGLRDLALAQPPPAISLPKSSNQPSGKEEENNTSAERQTSNKASTNIVIYVAASIRDRLRNFTAHNEITYTDAVLDAIDDQQSKLGELFGETQSGRRSNSLFDSRPRSRRRHPEPQVQVGLRLNKDDLKILDQLVKDHYAGSRSYFIGQVLNNYLPQVQGS